MTASASLAQEGGESIAGEVSSPPAPKSKTHHTGNEPRRISPLAATPTHPAESQNNKIHLSQNFTTLRHGVLQFPLAELEGTPDHGR